MPVIPEGPLPISAPVVFCTVFDVLDMARAVLNDMQIDANGDLLSNTQPYTLILLNLAYSNLQAKLADSGVEAVSVKEAVITGIPPSPAIDPATQVRIGYDGYFDGVNATQYFWQLPQDMRMPMELWERPSGQNVPYQRMTQRVGGFEGFSLNPYFGIWEIRDAGTQQFPGIWFPACTMTTDLRLRYVPMLSRLSLPEDGQPPMQIPLARCGQALAYMLAAEFARARGAVGAVGLQQSADALIDMLANESAKRMQGAPIIRARYGRGKWRRRGC